MASRFIDFLTNLTQKSTTIDGTEIIHLGSSGLSQKANIRDVTSYTINNLAQTWNSGSTVFTGVKLNVTDTASSASSLLMDLQVGGVSKFNVTKSGELVSKGVTLTVGNGSYTSGCGLYVELNQGINNPFFAGFRFNTVNVAAIGASNATNLVVSGSGAFTSINGFLGFNGGANWNIISPDITLYRDAAGTLAQRNSTNAQAFRVYKSYTDASNYSRLAINDNQIKSEVLGSGSLEVTASRPVLDLAQTWNEGSTVFTGLKFNVTDTASSASSLLMDLQVGGATQFSVSKSGGVYLNERTYMYVSDSNTVPVRINSGTVISSVFKNSSGVTEPAFIVHNNLSFKSANGTGQDVSIFYTGSGTLNIAQTAYTSDTSPSKLNVYATAYGANNYQRCGIKTGKVTLSNVTGATVTATGLIPAGAFVIGVTSRVNTTCTTATGYTVGTAGDADLWGVASAVAAGTATGSANFTAAGASGLFTAATDVIVTATGGDFDGTGIIELAIHYLLTEAD